MTRAPTLVAKKKPTDGDGRLAEFGRRVRLRREAAGLTQAELAVRSGLHRITVLRLEAGSIDPTWTNILNLAGALGASPNDFIADDQQTDPEPEPPAKPMGKRK